MLITYHLAIHWFKKRNPCKRKHTRVNIGSKKYKKCILLFVTETGIVLTKWVNAKADDALVHCVTETLTAHDYIMMTSSNGNIFRVTGHLCGEFTGDRWIPAQRPVMRRSDVFVDLRLNERFSKQSWGWWFETPSRPLWRHSNVGIHNEG